MSLGNAISEYFAKQRVLKQIANLDRLSGKLCEQNDEFRRLYGELVAKNTQLTTIVDRLIRAHHEGSPEWEFLEDQYQQLKGK